MSNPSASTPIDRPPRIQPELPFDTIQIPKPPEPVAEGQARLIQIGLPLVTIIGYVLVSTLGGAGRSPALLLPMALSVLAATAFSFYTFRKDRQRRREIEQAYADRLVELAREMEQAHDAQRRFYTYNYPDPTESLRIVQQSRALANQSERTLRAAARLWERRTSDDDFGVVRLGVGTRPSTVVYTLDNVDQIDTPQVRAARKLAADSLFVDSVPVTLALRTPFVPAGAEPPAAAHPPSPQTHALAIAGTPAAVRDLIQALLAQIVVFHAPGDLRLYLIAAADTPWQWASQLPHARDEEGRSAVLFTTTIKSPIDATSDEGDALDQYLEALRRVLVQRKIRLQEREGTETPETGDPTLPFCLLVVDLLDLAGQAGRRLESIATDPALAILLAEGAALGASVIFLVPERTKVPSACRAVIEVEETTPQTNRKAGDAGRIFFRYAEIGLNSFRYVGVAERSETTQMAQLADVLQTLTLRQGPGAGLPGSVPFLDLYGYASLHDLRDDAWKRWNSEREDWLRVRLGIMSGNKPRTLVFSAKRDGVHGMVAGSTGSGKSELLISLIAGLAVNYDPRALNFVLVDYKGGGAFKEFADLPHCVDIITNLAADGVTRMFTAIQAEMQRRQSLNAATGTKNIVEYRQKGLHTSYAPYPFLFIIIDEFAEMIADRDEYRAQLESITRVGRAQGVSLILAAQRPSGVTDQMRSNIKFRICLRVETPAESREMLRRGDAAFLPSGIPGRGFLQVGNEEVELVQVAYSGEIYNDPQRKPPPPVIWPGRGGGVVATDETVPTEVYKLIVGELTDLARTQQVPAQNAPWPGMLPTRFTLSEVLIAADPTRQALTAARYLADVDRITLGRLSEPDLTLSPALSHWLQDGTDVYWVDSAPIDHANFWQKYAWRPVVGLVDNPHGARQLPLVIDLTRGHTVLYGGSGWGKSTFLRTLTLSLATSHSPDLVHFYLLDLGGRNLHALKGMPHVGAVITPDEESYEERVVQLLRQLDELVSDRKNRFGNAGCTDIADYNQAHPAAPLAAQVVLLDNFAEFVATFGAQPDDAESVLQRFIGLLRQSRPYGVYVVVTAAQPVDLPNSVASLFSERLTLRLSDPGEYRAIVGGAVDEIGPFPGRGYVRIDGRPLAFQVALPIDLLQNDQAQPANEANELIQLAMRMCKHIAASPRVYSTPVRVDGLQRSLPFHQLLARTRNLSLGADFLDQLRTMTRQNWQLNRTSAKAEWLHAIIGAVAGDRPRTLALEAKADGVHGLIAGGTGSGKSELLMSLIVSLALDYAPDTLNFVLVDYKGGGTFQSFSDLPHVVDIVTNLNRSAVKRVFTSITAEMQRRQALNAATGTNDIVAYRHKGLHLTREPYPFLFIIIDEYAEMIKDNPEFAEELDSITRLGRAQGVHLLLASQRPIGVSDQMRANIKLRICLRVEQADTSREMLRRPDAAYLPSIPGRGYLQVGNNAIELIQVAYVGDTLPPTQSPPAVDASPSTVDEAPKFYAVAVKLARELLGSDLRPQAPWPQPLPRSLTFATPVPINRIDPATLPILEHAAQQTPTCLNDAVTTWLDKRGVWPGVDWNTIALRGIVGLIDNPAAARQLPFLVDLARGNAVLFGASGWGKTTFLRSLAVSLAVTHSPAELQMHVLDLGGRALEVLNNLPHVGAWITPDEPGYEERIQQLWRHLNDEIDRRKRLFSGSTFIEYNSVVEHTPVPAIVVLIDNVTELIETFGVPASSQNESDNPLDVFVAMARQGRAYGVHFVITATRPTQLSSKLYNLFTERYTLLLAEASEYSVVVGSGAGAIDEVPGRGIARVGKVPLVFQIALLPGTVDDQGRVRGEAAQVKRIAEAMEAYITAEQMRFSRPPKIGALPSTVPAGELFARSLAVDPQPSVPFADLVRDAMQRQWQMNASAKDAAWLRAPVGVVSGGTDRALRLEASYDGVHGMIAGGTGSGKSELLTTFIVGLALHYSPETLNFVLVDYKGGGTFQSFADLPHVVDMVTNLNKVGVYRMFTAIDAEIRRRQRLNAETGTKDIVAYRQKDLHHTHAPYPHLVVIIDEYAEMITDSPEFRAQLESITRVGRAQGVNLILASQRPTGVSDQMRANIKLRICLRVEQTETSREMLRRPDAAFLPSTPGRGYLQVGNEQIELIQMAWAGEEQKTLPSAPVIWPDRSPASAVPAGEQPRLFDVAVALADDLAQGRPAPRLWPVALPSRFSLDTPVDDGKGSPATPLVPALPDWFGAAREELWPGIDWSQQAMRPLVGLIDVADEARRDALSFNLARTHLAVFGDAGSGKTNLLRSMLLSLATTHSPDELHAYVLDLGGRSFNALGQLPHIGTVIYADEEHFEERMQRLFDLLTQLIEDRQRLMSENGETNFYSFNRHFPDLAQPAVLVLIDNIAELVESYAQLVETIVIPLLRRAINVGVSFVVTANVLNNLPGKLGNLFSERITLRQSKPDQYLDIVGRGAVELDETPGRGYLRVNQRPLLFQAALPIGIAAVDGSAVRLEKDDLEDLVAVMRQVSEARGLPRRKPDPIRELPTHVPLADLLTPDAVELSAHPQILLGFRAGLQPVLVKIQQPHFAIIGPSRSGRTTTLQTWILNLAERYTPDQVRMVLVDPRRRCFDYGGARSLQDLPHVLAAIGDTEELPQLLERLPQEVQALGTRPGYALFMLIDNFEEFCEDLGTRVARIAALARRHGSDGFHVVIAAGTDGAGTNDLRRAVMRDGFGLGLRTSQALDALKVQRMPAELRSGRELPPGRGYVVRSGQLVLLQVATPHAGRNEILDGGNDARHTAVLDTWVTRILQRHGPSQYAWSKLAPTTAARSPQDDRLTALLRRIAQHELADLKAGKLNGHSNGPLIAEALVQPELFQEQANRLALLREACIRVRIVAGMARIAAEYAVEALPIDSEAELLTDLENNLNNHDN